MPRLGSLSSRSLIGTRLVPALLPIYDAIANATYSDLTVATTPVKFNSTGSIGLPYNTGGAGTGGRLNTPSAPSSGIFTVELWRYHSTAPSGSDFLFEIKSATGSYLMIELSGSIRSSSFLMSGPNWTVATGTWEHYVIVVNIGTGKLATAKNGIRGSNTDLTAIWTWPGALGQINFKSSLYNSLANGFADEVRVSTGDIYNLYTSSTYTTPTALLSTSSPAVHLFKAR